MARYQSYVICTSPRSGSTLLCKLLGATGRSGLPGSHFHDPSLSDWLSYHGLRREQFATERDALKAVFSAAVRTGTGDTGMFGLRLQRHSFDFFMRKLELLHPDRPGAKARFQAAFGETLFIHLTRENKLEQAISYVKASQTGLWHMAPDGTELERLSAPREPVYDAKAIGQQLAGFTAADKDWKAWFAGAGIEALRLTYDELSEAPQSALARVLRRLGVEHAPPDDQALPVAKLADATNQAWAERFLEQSTRPSALRP